MKINFIACIYLIIKLIFIFKLRFPSGVSIAT
jgi:hypothetical protein